MNVQNAVSDLVPESGRAQVQSAAGILDRDDERELVGAQNLDRIYSFIDRALNLSGDKSARHVSDAAELDVNHFYSADQSLALLVEFELDVRFGESLKI